MGIRDEEELREMLRKMKLDAEIDHDERLSYFKKQAVINKESARERRVKLIATSSALIALLGGMSLSFYQSFMIGGVGNQFETMLGFVDKKDVASVEDLRMIQDAMKKASESYSDALRNLAKTGDGSVAELEIVAIKSSIDSIDKRLGVLEKAISDNPEKALSIPLLRKDQENMVKSIEGNRVYASVELSRIYDQQKWILGGIGTVLLAAITGLISVLYKLVFRPDQSDSASPLA